MKFEDCININQYGTVATRRFSEVQNQLNTLDTNLQSRSNGKSVGSLVGTSILSVIWLASYIIFTVVAWEYMPLKWLLIVAGLALGGLLAVMIVDTATDFGYYEKIARLRNELRVLRSGVSDGVHAIRNDQQKIAEAANYGWNMELNKRNSVPGEATGLANNLAGIESLKKGFIGKAKPVMYFTAVVAVTLAECIALYPVASNIINGFAGGSFNSDVLAVLDTVALILTMIGEIMLAKLAWSANNCEVTNVMLLVLLAGAIGYLGVTFIGSLLVMLVIFVVKILVMIVVGAVMLAAVALGAFGSLSQ